MQRKHQEAIWDMRLVARVFVAIALFAIVAEAASLAVRYPSYRYVMEKLDIDPSYINNPQFVSFVNKNEAKYRRFYTRSIKRGEKYIPTFTELLLSSGLSHLFVYLSMTESGFKSYAKSNKSAAGLWQFMSATARNYSLVVNKKVDQRYDPIASTQAAIKYINKLYKDFGKGYLVMMAYNCGGGRLSRTIKKVGTDEFAVLMDSSRRLLPSETIRYLKKIILLSMMGEHIVQSNKPEDKKIKEKIINGETFVNVVAGTRILDIVDILDMSLPEFMEMNPHVRWSKVPLDAFLVQIAIPSKKLEQFKKHYSPPTLKQIYKKGKYTRLITHVVKKGENLSSISRMYGDAPLTLIIANELTTSKIIPGQPLMIPVTEETFRNLRGY